MKALALFAIRLYQRHLSPRKGFNCAYRAHTGRASCSALGYRAVRRHGAWRGYAILRRRLERCGAVHRRQRAAEWARSQAGFCDLPCDVSCDGGDASGACDVLSAAGDCGSCDGWPAARHNRRENVEVRIRNKKVLGPRKDGRVAQMQRRFSFPRELR
jgi:uncharacterized protein